MSAEMNADSEFQGYTIDNRGRGMCAVFQLVSPGYSSFGPPATEAVFNEASLAGRVENLKAQGLSAPLSEAALADIRARQSSKPATFKRSGP